VTRDRHPDEPRPADRRHDTARVRVDRAATRRLAVVFAVVLVVMGVAHVVGAMLLGLSVLDLGAEEAVGTWVTSGLHALCAVVSATVALLARRGRTRWEKNWWLLAAVFALMSLDEVAAVHDRLLEPVRHALHTTGIFFYAWVIPALALGAVFLLVQTRFLAALDRRTRRGLILAGAVFVAGAAGMEMAEGWLASDGQRTSGVFGLLVLVEELTEMAALMLAACVLLRHLVDTYGALQISFVPVPDDRRVSG
jgi:hypothetical protein